jgi:hypothetical protein
MQTPLTVRIPTERPNHGFLDDSSLADLFDDPAFRGFFGGATEKDITVSSPPADVTVLELPTAGRPREFSGAVGQFKISSEVSDTKATAGDPVTLRMKISGAGNFDRVNSSMLADVDHWKTYQPAARFTESDTPFRGEKTFEQPVVATEPGEQTLPALTFSYFDPETRRYETLRTAPLTVQVAPAPASVGSAGAAVGAQAAPESPLPPQSAQHEALRPDHAAAGDASASLVPLYCQPRYVALPSVMAVGLPLVWLWLRRRDRRQRLSGSASGSGRAADRARLLGDMDRALAAGNVGNFFAAVRTLLLDEMSSRWRLAPEAVTMAEIEARLGADSELRNLFALADEALYSGRRFARPELERWRRVALQQSKRGMAA